VGVEHKMKDEIQRHETHTRVLAPIPEQVDAGTDLLLKVQVSCPEGCSLAGGRVRIADEEGTIVEEVDLASSDGGTNETDEFRVTAPVALGPTTWTALFLPAEAEEIQHEPSSVPLTFTVKPHTLSLSAWGVPLPVTKGEEFTVKIGAKCSADCSLAGLGFLIRDEEGNVRASGQIGDDLLPMTSGLRWTEQTLVAPAREGLYTWTVECLASELELPHQVSTSSLRLRTVAPPDRVVTVEVVDTDQKTPLEGVSIFIHPYKCFTDEQGIGRIEVGKGKHDLYVKKQDYVPFETTVEVDEDVRVKAELFWCPDPYA
jgi:hypothetical protein